MTVTAGSIVRRVVVDDDGTVRDPEHLYLTVSFKHNRVGRSCGPWSFVASIGQP